MADDVQEVTGTDAAIAARLCNFVTGQAVLLPTHKDWLNSQVQPILLSLQNPWVDLFGYASHLGSAQFNKQLSLQRLQAVKAYIAGFPSRAQFIQEVGEGEEKSGPDEQDNSGYYRAVDVFIYGSKPVPRRMRIPRPRRAGSTNFEIRFVGGGSGGKNVFQVDAMFFQIVDKTQMVTAFYFFGGKGFAVPTGTPGSASGMGSFVPFRTRNATFLPAFSGAATLGQPPQVTTGPKSINAVVVLSMFGPTLLGNFTIPKDLTIPTGSGVGVSLGSATQGQLQIVKGPLPFTGP